MRFYNTGESAEDLKQNYNPEGSILRKAQYRMLDMLLYLDSICKSQGVNWCLEGGNVLGAVRHNGFIPWDDDADIIMPRKDYKKLIKYLKKNPHSQFVLQTHCSDKKYYGSWVVLRDLNSEYVVNSKVHNSRRYRGLQVDIFPIQIGYFRFLHRIAQFVHYRNRTMFVGKHDIIANMVYHFEQNLMCPLFRFLSYLFGNKKIFSYEYGHEHCKNFYMEDCFPPTPLIFENVILPGPNNLDRYLKCLYGKYMDLPPVEKNYT